MASFTDNISVLGNFNPYVQVLPTEALAQVGMIKQEEFDKGVQQVQGYVDSLSGLPIAKGEVKNYVQTKLGQLKEGVTKNLAGDFSDHRVVNQIGGAAKLIARDPIVQNGVTSTARMQSSLSELADAKKAGKSAPQNEAHLQNSVSEWINDGQLDSSFNGSYTPYVDVTDRFLKLYKEQNPGEDIPQDAYRTDANGNTVINPILFKGKGPAKIQALFNVVASQPDVQNQLKIDGWYKYRGVTQNQLGQALVENTNSTLKNIEGAIQSLQAKIALGSTDSTLSTQIEQLKQQALDRRKSFDGLAGLIKNNPETAKGELAKQELASNLINAYSYQAMEKSPLWETSMQQKVFDREYYEWQQTYDQNERKLQWDVQKDTETLRLAREKAERDKKAAGGNDTVTAGQITSSEIATGSTQAYNNLNASADEYGQSVFELAARTAHGGNDSPTVLDNVTGKYKYNYGSSKLYKTKEAAADAVAAILAHSRDAYMNGGIGDAAANTLMERVNQKWDNYQSNSQIVTDVESKYKIGLKEIGVTKDNEDYAKFVMVEKKMPGWENLRASLVGKYGEDFEDKLGIGKFSGSSGPGGGVYLKGSNYSKYEEAKKLINDKSSAVLGAREEDFTRRNTTDIPYVVTHDVSKPEVREEVNTKFFALASARALNPSTGKGDASNILELTGRDKSKRGDLQYQSGIDPQTGIAYIKVGDQTMEISRAEYERQFPERVYNNQFRETFGSRLNQTQWQSTDPLGDSNGGGRGNAYKVMLDKPDFPFVVQYHLVNQGSNKYAMRWWVTPKPTADNESPTPIINGEYASGTLIGMPETLTEEEVVKWKDKLKDSNWLKDQLIFKFRQK